MPGSSRLFPRLASEDERPALVVEGERVSYRQLGAACARHAERLAQLGVARGDRVAVWTQRAIGTPVALMGNAMAGVVSVPLNPSLGVRELEHILSDAEPRLIMAACPEEVADRAPHLPLTEATCDAAASVSGSACPRRKVDEAPLLILYTSGTTGPPKGAVLSARNAAANLDGLAAAWSWTEADTVVHALPLFHVHGLVLGLFGSLRVGGCLRWVPRFTVDGVCEALDDGGTMLFGVPTMYHRLADAAEQRAKVAGALARARLLVSGSAALPLREHRRIEAATGRGVVERYGLTETLINCAVVPGSPEPAYVGPPVPGVELRLVDERRLPMNVCDDVTIGEVAVRGDSVFSGYLNRPEATEAVLDVDGWFYTGDLATRTPTGSIRIVGRRATDLIKTGGFKVGAQEVESALLEDPAVVEAAVVGVPDADLGERIVAFIVPRDPEHPPSPDALGRHVARQLSPHKRPREVRFLDALPRNPMGKVQKHLLTKGNVAS